MKEVQTEKRSRQETIKNIRKILTVVSEIDSYYLYECGMLQMLSAGILYLELILSAWTLDRLMQGKKFEELFPAVAGMIAVIFILNTVCSVLRGHTEVRCKRIFQSYICKTEQKILAMDFSRIDSSEVNELKERIRKDNNWGAGIYSVCWQINGIFSAGWKLLFAVLVGVPVLFQLTSSGQGLLCGSILLLMIIIVLLKKRAQVYERKMWDLLDYTPRTDEERLETLSGLGTRYAMGEGIPRASGKDIRIYGTYDIFYHWLIEQERASKIQEVLKKAGAAGAKAEFGGNAVNGMLEAGAYLLAGVLALGGAMTVGNVVKLAGCLRNIFTEFTQLTGNFFELGLSAARQVSTLEFLELMDEMYKGKLPLEKRSDNQYTIEFRNVSFRYPGSEQYALKDFSLYLKAGERLAIVGMNGSGKTTMIKLLCRLYDPQEGEILLNGVDIRKFKHEEYNRLFSVIFQDYQLFSLGLAENVAASKEYDSKHVEQCLEEAGFGARLRKLKNGLETYLYKEFEDDGVEISGGEAQKIAIARAMYKEAAFILLDEPTAALDPLSEYEVYNSFDKIAGNKTAIYISHRLSSCRFCEKIVVFHEGRLIQQGTHEELLKQVDGKYAELWNAQAQYYMEKNYDSILYKYDAVSR